MVTQRTIEIKKCNNCNKDIEIKYKGTSNNKNIFCSKKCEDEFKNKILINNCVCDYCGKEYHVKPSRLKMYKTHFCSMMCHALYKKEHFVGENNHQYGLKGELNSSFKSNEKITSYGYKKIRVLDHPFKDCDDFVFEHRLIAEKYLLNNENCVIVNGIKYLNPNLVVHHIDENKLNNDVLNLKIITKEEHMHLHKYIGKPKLKTKQKIKELKGIEIACKNCNKIFYTTDRNRICCSLECSNKLRGRRSEIINCSNCEKPFKIKGSRLDKSKNLFCCKSCYYEYKRK